jgi:hypothetical protein
VLWRNLILCRLKARRQLKRKISLCSRTLDRVVWQQPRQGITRLFQSLSALIRSGRCIEHACLESWRQSGPLASKSRKLWWWSRSTPSHRGRVWSPRGQGSMSALLPVGVWPRPTPKSCKRISKKPGPEAPKSKKNSVPSALICRIPNSQPVFERSVKHGRAESCPWYPLLLFNLPVYCPHHLVIHFKTCLVTSAHLLQYSPSRITVRRTDTSYCRPDASKTAILYCSKLPLHPIKITCHPSFWQIN